MGEHILAKGDPVSAWEALSPYVALLLAALILWLVALLALCVVGLVRRDPWRCWAGHKWVNAGDRWDAAWSCSRCEKPAPVCRNCGHQHDPDAIVSTGGWR